MAPRKANNNSQTAPELLMLGYLCIKDAKSLPEMVDILDRFGLSGPDVARICNCAEGAIRNVRLELKRRNNAKGSDKPDS